MPNFISTTLTIFQLIISFGTVCTLLYTVVKYTQKPQDIQNERILALEKWRDTMDAKMMDTCTHLSSLDEGTKITQQAILALMGHAINGEDVEELKKARQTLYDYLTNG